MRKIGELKGKPIIEGNPNEIKNNQIHYKESEGNINLSERKNGNLENIVGGSSAGSSSKYAPRYFSIDFNIADEGWKYLLSINDAMNPIYQDNIVVNIGATYKVIVEENNKGISAYPFMTKRSNSVTQFSYIPLYMSDTIAGSIGIKGGFLTFEDIITNMPTVLRGVLEKEITLSMNGITEISEEEFYKID